jgi:hypothetical protein
VTYGGEYNLEPRVAIWDGPGAFKITIGETLDSGSVLSFGRNDTGGSGSSKYYIWTYMSGQKIHLNSGHNRIFLQAHSIQNFNCIGFRLTSLA